MECISRTICSANKPCGEIQAVIHMTYLKCTVVSSCILLHDKGLISMTSCGGGTGVEEHCKEYQYVEQRQGWEAEQRRLKKELEKHSKQATKVRPASSCALLLWQLPAVAGCKVDASARSLLQAVLLSCKLQMATAGHALPPQAAAAVYKHGKLLVLSMYRDRKLQHERSQVSFKL